MGHEPDFGDKVTYINNDGDEHNAIILEPIPDAEYVTVAVSESDPRNGYIGPSWSVKTSVYPHADIGDEYTATGYAYKPGWE